MYWKIAVRLLLIVALVVVVGFVVVCFRIVHQVRSSYAIDNECAAIDVQITDCLAEGKLDDALGNCQRYVERFGDDSMFGEGAYSRRAQVYAANELESAIQDLTTLIERSSPTRHSDWMRRSSPVAGATSVPACAMPRQTLIVRCTTVWLPTLPHTTDVIRNIPATICTSSTTSPGAGGVRTTNSFSINFSSSARMQGGPRPRNTARRNGIARGDPQLAAFALFTSTRKLSTTSATWTPKCTRWRKRSHQNSRWPGLTGTAQKRR